jgi:nicotinamide riboside transporter PnuC
MVVIAIVVVGFRLLYFMLKRFTSSTVPFWDAWASTTAWAGMWLLARRKIENWILLNVSNLFAIPFYPSDTRLLSVEEDHTAGKPGIGFCYFIINSASV